MLGAIILLSRSKPLEASQTSGEKYATTWPNVVTTTNLGKSPTTGLLALRAELWKVEEIAVRGWTLGLGVTVWSLRTVVRPTPD